MGSIMARNFEERPDTGQRTSPSVQLLLAALNDTPQGAIQGSARDKIIELLRGCWQDLEGADETSMEAWKICRLEDLSWNPPLLSFTIERHGATVLGSSRAELHKWTVIPNLATAKCAPGGYRQLVKAAPKLDVKSIAARVCDAVQQGPASNCDLVKQGIVVWRDSGHCSINHLALLPSDGYRQTVAGRRRRLRDELRKRMQALGWQLRHFNLSRLHRSAA
jgi:hypothetical protein